jgi:hypothetical protein
VVFSLDVLLTIIVLGGGSSMFAALIILRIFFHLEHIIIVQPKQYEEILSMHLF